MSKVYQKIATLVGAIENCRKADNVHWEKQHGLMLADIVRDKMPSGSGFDTGTSINIDDSTAERLIFETAYHHMTDAGYYNGWTAHRVIVTPSLQFGFNLRITGRNRNEIKEYIADAFQSALDADA